MNRLICPACDRPSYTANLQGPFRCAHEDCDELLLPGEEVDGPDERRLSPRVGKETRLTVEYLVGGHERTVERDLEFVDTSLVGFSTVLEDYPPLGSQVTVELSDAGADGQPLRVRGRVREVQPGEPDGFRVGIEITAPEREPDDHRDD